MPNPKRPKLGRPRAKRAGVCRCLPQSGQIWPDRCRPNFDQVRRISAKFWQLFDKRQAYRAACPTAASPAAQRLNAAPHRPPPGLSMLEAWPTRVTAKCPGIASATAPTSTEAIGSENILVVSRSQEVIKASRHMPSRIEPHGVECHYNRKHVVTTKEYQQMSKSRGCARMRTQTRRHRISIDNVLFAYYDTPPCMI